MKFIDKASLYIKAGDGGSGHVSFRKEKFVPRGGPDGGNGGKGGDVIFIADPHLNTLFEFNFNKKFIAYNGKRGAKARKTGKNGSDLIVKVPVGTEIINAESGELLFDIVNQEENVVVARGGIGGKGNSEFKTATRQAPRFSQPGIPGEEFFVELQLKLLANVGIVGFPNAGKSTLISTISAAKPKIADYPFTTLVPNLGVVKYGEYDSFVVADIPGLIEGAGEGKGLGIQFLKHIERTNILLYLLDASSENIKEDYKTLKKELKKFNPDMLEKKEIIALSKMDIVDEEKKAELMKLKINKMKPILISAVINLGIEELITKLYNAVQIETNE
jgi:GTP-binding protein